RQDAHELLRQLAIKSAIEKRHFKEILLNNETIRKFLSEEEVSEALDPKNYLGTTIEQIENAIKITRLERLERGLKD
ncbi:MAG: adenylosuccinate lyase, partial [Candidatus Bathyarchaeia archaeon]